MGFSHALGLDCGDVTLAAVGCTEINYANPMDPMGQGGGPYDLAHQIMVGWVGNSTYKLTTVSGTGSGSYTIGNLDDSASSRPKGLRVARSINGIVNEYIYVEHRGDPGSNTVWLTKGDVLDDYHNDLLDPSPAGDFGGFGLYVGDTFVDPLSGISISVTAANTTGATLLVSVGPVTSPPRSRR
jgi:hypothetical protein